MAILASSPSRRRPGYALKHAPYHRFALLYARRSRRRFPAGRRASSGDTPPRAHNVLTRRRDVSAGMVLGRQNPFAVSTLKARGASTEKEELQEEGEARTIALHA